MDAVREKFRCKISGPMVKHRGRSGTSKCYLWMSALDMY